MLGRIKGYLLDPSVLENIFYILKENTMGLELKQFGQTLAVGAFAMLGFWLILRMLKGDLLKNILPSEDRLKQINLVFNGVLLAFVFAVGIILENFSKHIVAERDPPIEYVRKLFGYNLRKDKETRFDVLFKQEDENFKPNDFCTRLESESYFNSLPDYIIKSYLDTNTDVNKFRFDTSKINMDKKLLIATNYLNNNAKDRVFQENNYYTELIALTSRMDFLRAFIFLSTLLIYLNLIVISALYFKKSKDKCDISTWFKEKIAMLLSVSLLISIIITSCFEWKELLKIELFICIIWVFRLIYLSCESLKEANKIKEEELLEKQKTKDLKDQNLNSLLLFTAFCLLLSFILPSAYEAECSNYNRRVLGYHLSLYKKEKKDCDSRIKEISNLKSEIDNLKKKLPISKTNG